MIQLNLKSEINKIDKIKALSLLDIKSIDMIINIGEDKASFALKIKKYLEAAFDKKHKSEKLLSLIRDDKKNHLDEMIEIKNKIKLMIKIADCGFANIKFISLLAVKEFNINDTFNLPAASASKLNSTISLEAKLKLNNKFGPFDSNNIELLRDIEKYLDNEIKYYDNYTPINHATKIIVDRIIIKYKKIRNNLLREKIKHLEGNNESKLLNNNQIKSV